MIIDSLIRDPVVLCAYVVVRVTRLLTAKYVDLTLQVQKWFPYFHKSFWRVSILFSHVNVLLLTSASDPERCRVCVSVCACVRACVLACVLACVRACVCVSLTLRLQALRSSSEGNLLQLLTLMM